jgi:hypothetical protein
MQWSMGSDAFILRRNCCKLRGRAVLKKREVNRAPDCIGMPGLGDQYTYRGPEGWFTHALIPVLKKFFEKSWNKAKKLP